jgi:hypothetical protein
MILIWDNLAGHHSGRMHRAIKERDWLQVENLLSYAPDLNPAEMGLPWCDLRSS